MSEIDKLIAIVNADIPDEAVRMWMRARLEGGLAVYDDMLCHFPDGLFRYMVDAGLLELEGDDFVALDPPDDLPSFKRPSRRLPPGAADEVAKKMAAAPLPDPPTPLGEPHVVVPEPSKRVAKDGTTRGRPSKLDKLEGLERAKAAFENPRWAGAQVVIEESTGWAFRRYNDARRRKRVETYPPGHLARFKKHWRELARFLICNDVDAETYLDFIYMRTKWQNNKFPTPQVVAGPWAQAEWENRAEGVGRTEVAGAAYTAPETEVLDVVRRAAAKLGHTDLDDDLLAHLGEQALLRNSEGHLYTPDPEFEAVEKLAAEMLRRRT